MVNAQAFFVWFIDLPVSFFQKSCEKLAIKILHNIICNISLAAHFIHPEWQVNGMAYDRSTSSCICRQQWVYFLLLLLVLI